MTHDLPLAVGVFGPWGSGKSSFLNICRDLLRERGFAAVSFNPWKYDKRDQIWHALIQTLLDELIQLAETPEARGISDRLKDAVRKAWQLRAALAWLAAGTLAPIVTHGVVSGDIVSKARDIVSGQENLATDGYRHINVFEKDFADTVKALTDDRRMVVLVDDLDRCRGESALMALEALRLFTGDAPCVFIAAMDYQALAHAASEHFGDSALLGRNYLEKLINFPYYLPAVRFESIHRAFSAKLDYLADDEAMWELIRNHMGGNPRRIRRFINAFNLSVAMLAQSSPPSRERQMQVAILLMIRQEHPAFFEFLERDARAWDQGRGSADAWGELAAIATGRSSQDLPAEIRELVKADPGLPHAVASVGPGRREELGFPPPPTRDQISILTQAMVLMPSPAATASPGTRMPS